jgi:hypothetical protein
MFLISHRTMRVLLAALLTALCGSTALAGGRESSLPIVDTVARYASGDMQSARQAMNNSSRLGCSVNSDNVISCTAYHPLSIATCTKFFPSQAMVNAVLNLGSDGYLYFAWNSSGTCTQIITDKGSKWAPKTQ